MVCKVEPKIREKLDVAVQVATGVHCGDWRELSVLAVAAETSWAELFGIVRIKRHSVPFYSPSVSACNIRIHVQ